MDVLLLCDYRLDGAATVLDHINALRDNCGHRVFMLSVLGDLPAALELERFDAIIVHYSLIVSNDYYVSPLARSRLRAFPGLKVVFIQDEYRWVNATIEGLRLIGAHLLFTCVPAPEVAKVYDPQALPGLRTVSVLTGYVPKELLGVAPKSYAERTVDVGYRARKLSALFGSLAREKWVIADRFAEDARRYGLQCDLSYHEEHRLYGQAWIDFIRSCKAVLGSESGASVFDFTGEIKAQVEAYEASHRDASFEEIRDRFFPGADGVVKMNQISPRCFEAAALRTMMILYEGEYSGVLEPWRHYVPLRKDHSNMDEIVAVLRDERRWSEIVERAYEEVACNPRWSHEAFGQLVGRSMTEEAARLVHRSRRPYADTEFAAVIEPFKARVDELHAERLEYAKPRFVLAAKLLTALPAPFAALARYFWRRTKTLRFALDLLEAAERAAGGAPNPPSALSAKILLSRLRGAPIFADLVLLERLRELAAEWRHSGLPSPFKLRWLPVSGTLEIVADGGLTDSAELAALADVREAFENRLVREIVLCCPQDGSFAVATGLAPRHPLPGVQVFGTHFPAEAAAVLLDGKCAGGYWLRDATAAGGAG